MPHFKLIVIRKDGIHYESTFGGWHAETAAYATTNTVKADTKTLMSALYSGRTSKNSDDIVWEVIAMYVAPNGAGDPA